MMKNNFKLIIAIMVAIPLMLLISCNTDDDGDTKTNEFLPVLEENFNFTVDGNDVNFTTTITGNVWVTVNEVNHTFVDGKVTVNLPNKGTYTFTCSSQGSGETLISEPFEVVIEQDDLSFLNEGLWKYLSGGANETKTWRLDMTAEAEVVYFNGPLSYSGYSDGDIRKTEWSYWAWDVLPEELPVTVNGQELSSFFNWEPGPDVMVPGDYGTITFNGTAGTVSMTDITGAETSGSFTFDPETWKLGLSGVILPIDTARLNEGQYKEEHLANVRIFTLTDSAMQIGIKRSYEGFNDDGTQKVSEWVNVYNFIVDDYEYPVEEFTYTEPLDADFTSADLVGTWKLGGAPVNWISWLKEGNMGTTEEASVLNDWPDRTAFKDGWFGATDDQLAAVDALEHQFMADGSCTIGGISTTYSVSGGVVTFADSVGLVAFDGHWFGSINGTTFSVLDLATPETGGIWIGVQDGDSKQSKVAQIVKQ